MEKKHGNPIAFLKWVAEFQDENGNYIELTGDRWHFSDKDDTDNVTEDQLWELYKLHYPDVEDQLATANETIKVLEYDNNRLKGEVEGLTSALDELRTKYDNILATESGHESKTENVWQSGYAAGHEAGCERGKREAQPGAVWVKGAPKERKQHFAKVPSALDEDIFYEAVIWPISDSDHWWCVGEGFKFTTHKDNIIAHIDESAAGESDAVELLRWLNENDWSGVGSGEYINSTNGRILKEEKLYQEFKRRGK